MQFFPNGTRIRAKSPAPKTIADQHRIRTAEMLFFVTEFASERWRLRNTTKCRPEVACCRFQFRQSMYIPQFLFDLLAPAKFQQRFSPRVVWCHPGGNVLVNEFLDMKANF